jgi:hypothetical protein
MWVALLLAASPGSVELHWEAPPECPDAVDFEGRVSRYLEGSKPREDPVRVEATIDREGDRWRLRLVTMVGDERQQRELDDSDCEGLTESAAVLAAIAVAPELANVPDPSDRVPPPADSDSDSDSVAADATTPTIVPEPPAPPPPAVHASLRAIGGASLGWLPPGADAGIVLAVFWHWLRLEVSGVYAPRRQIRYADPEGSGADVSGWAVGARACGVLHPTIWLDTPLCAGAEAGQVIGTAVALVDGRTEATTWAAAVVAPSLRFVVHPRVALWVSPELLVTLARPGLTVAGDSTPIFEAAPAGGRFHGGIELRFW